MTSVYNLDTNILEESIAYNTDGQITEKITNKIKTDSSIEKIEKVYTYDGLGNTTKIVSTNDGSTETKTYKYDLTNPNPIVLQETTTTENSNSEVTVDISYVYGAKDEKVVANVQSYTNPNNEQHEKTSSNDLQESVPVVKSYNLETDYLGSTRWATDANGEVVASTQYNDWGEVTDNNTLLESDSLISVNLTASYTGYIYDETSDWWIAGARTYAPEIKRFTSEDPEAGIITEPDRIIQYTYAGNNPIRYVDRDGRLFGEIGDAVSSIGSSIADGVNSAVDYVGNKISSAYNSVKSSISNIIGGVKEGYSTFCKAVCTYAPGLWNSVNNLVDKLGNLSIGEKLAIGTVGAVIGLVCGLEVGTVATALVGGAFVGATIAGTAYVVSTSLHGGTPTLEDGINSMVGGATDGYMWGGIGAAISGIGTAIKASKTGVNTVKVSENVYWESTLEGGNSSRFNDVFDAADNYKLSNDTYVEHILDRHGPNSTYTNKSHFNSDFDIKSSIDSTLKGDNFIVRPNTNGRNGYIFEQTFNNAIGTNAKGKPLYTLKVVIDDLGNVITAFPKK
jgi:RHS repeat-associated protein